MTIDEVLINFDLFEDATEFLGQSDITLPNIQLITQEISGAGISGNLTTSVLGHVQAMSMDINFRTPTESALNLFKPGIHNLTAQGAIQETDQTTGTKKVVSVKYLIKAESTAFNPGKLAPASTTDTSGTYAVRAITMYRDGVKKFQIDPAAFIYEVGGKDYMADVRTALGK